MGLRRYLVLLALIACKPNGLLVEVPGDNVELFIASSEAPCSSDTGLCSMGPPDPASPMMPGQAHQAKRWITNTDELVTADGTVTDGVTQFLIEPDATTTTIPALLAVAFDGPNTNAMPTGFLVVPSVDVQAGTQDRLQLVLEPYTPLLSINPGAGERMQLWRKPSDSQPNTAPKVGACALVQHAAGAMYPFESFSPPSDTDCDEAEKVHECDRFAAFSTQPAHDDELDCLLPNPNTRLCVIGGHGCTDGAPAGMGACTASRETYCTSSPVCSDAEAAACTTPDCVNAQIIQQVTTSQYGLLCTYAHDGGGVPCALTGSTTAHVTAVLSQPACDDAHVSAATSPLAFSSSTSNVGGLVSVGVVDKNLCTIQLDVTPDVAVTDMTMLAFVEVQVSPPNLPPHHHVIPVVIQPTTGCLATGALVCNPLVVPTTGDSITKCN